MNSSVPPVVRKADGGLLRPWLILIVGVMALQGLFTAAVRLYVVPQLTPRVHVHSGLQQATDSEYFHGEASALSARLRQSGWRALTAEPRGSMLHVKILATIYYLAGDSPYAVYALNAVVAACSALLLFVFARGLGVSPWFAAGVAALLVSGPMFLFVHSELLREPYVVASFLIFALGLSVMIRIPERLGARTTAVQTGAMISSVIGFVAVAQFRPYLILPMLVALCVTFALCVVLPVAGHSSRRVSWGQGTLMAVMLVLLTAGFVVPQMRFVPHYGDAGASDEEIRQLAVEKAEAEQRLREKIEAFTTQAAPNLADPRSLTHDDIRIPTPCTVKWQPSAVLPAWIDRRGEALSCARQSHLIFCDESIMGARADQRCDDTMFSSFGDIVRHLPAGLLWSIAVPYPNMWLDGFGSGGTGLRRAAYVVDGVVSYALLPGLLGLAWRWRRRPEAVALAVGLLTIHVIYGLGVPTQFILARMRLSMYLPLLVLAAYGWRLMLLRDRT